MSGLIPFSFENHSIRVLTDENGEPLFVAKDIAAALGYVNTSDAISKHCRGVAERYPIIDNIGRKQEVRVIREPDLYRMMANSQLPSAQKFERLVFEEILPTIRKTGKYEVKPAAPPVPLLPAEVGKIIINTMMEVAMQYKVPASYAMQCASTEATRQTGLPWATMLSQAKCMNDVPETEMYLEPTQLGQIFGISARAMNNWLAAHGLQYKKGSAWEPTEEGRKFSQVHSWATKGKSGYNLKWNVAEIEQRYRDAVARAEARATANAESLPT